MKTCDILSNLIFIATASFLSVPPAYAGQSHNAVVASHQVVVSEQSQSVMPTTALVNNQVEQSIVNNLSEFTNLSNKSVLDFSLGEFFHQSSLYKLFLQAVDNNSSLKTSLPIVVWLFLSGFLGFLRFKRAKMVA